MVSRNGAEQYDAPLADATPVVTRD